MPKGFILLSSWKKNLFQDVGYSLVPPSFVPPEHLELGLWKYWLYWTDDSGELPCELQECSWRRRDRARQIRTSIHHGC